MSLVYVPCPVCQQADFAPVHPATITDPEAPPERYFSSSRQQAGYLPIVRCTGCGMVLQNPRDDAETLARVYAALSDPTYEDEDEHRKRAARAHLALLEEHRAGGRLLDLGCASGAFVAAAHAHGWQARGADASGWSIERARARCPGVSFEVGTLESLSFEPSAFDAVTLFDVLEHVDDPLATLGRIQGWLTPGGLLLLSIPNVASWMARLMGSRWVLLLREHLWYFSPETIARLLERAGFELLETRMKWVSFSVHNVLTRLGQYPGRLGREAQRLASMSASKRLSLQFPMGEMNVVARRASPPPTS